MGLSIDPSGSRRSSSISSCTIARDCSTAGLSNSNGFWVRVDFWLKIMLKLKSAPLKMLKSSIMSVFYPIFKIGHNGLGLGHLRHHVLTQNINIFGRISGKNEFRISHNFVTIKQLILNKAEANIKA